MLTYQKWIIEIWLSIVFGIQPAGGVWWGWGWGWCCLWLGWRGRKKKRFKIFLCLLWVNRHQIPLTHWALSWRVGILTSFFHWSVQSVNNSFLLLNYWMETDNELDHSMTLVLVYKNSYNFFNFQKCFKENDEVNHGYSDVCG